jgi:drug/metabolite transporter (DMT)-like permease
MIWFGLAFLSALLSAAAAIMQKKILFRMTALEFSFLVSVLTVAVCALIPLAVDVTSVSGPTIAIMLAKSVLSAAAFLLVMMSLERNQISSALPLLGLTPAITALLSLAATGEMLRGWEWGGIALMMGGTYLVERKPGNLGLRPFREVIAAKSHRPIIGALLLFAVTSVVDKSLLTGYAVKPLVVLFYQQAVYCLVFGAMVWIRMASFRGVIAKAKEQLPLILAVALLTVAYRLSQLEATRDAPVALVLAIKRTSILYATFFGGKMFSEDRLGMKLFGGALIIASGFVILRNVA